MDPCEVDSGKVRFSNNNAVQMEVKERSMVVYKVKDDAGEAGEVGKRNWAAVVVKSLKDGCYEVTELLKKGAKEGNAVDSNVRMEDIVLSSVQVPQKMTTRLHADKEVLKKMLVCGERLVSRFFIASF